MVEMSDLSIEKGKSAWKIFLDVYCLDHDGNVLDVALLSIMSTLKSLILPATIINENDHIVSIKKGKPNIRYYALPSIHVWTHIFVDVQMVMEHLYAYIIFHFQCRLLISMV
jgi:exosome complex RNA-binding protein Rrp42 (RNase PH superfamily)